MRSIGLTSLILIYSVPWVVFDTDSISASSKTLTKYFWRLVIILLAFFHLYGIVKALQESASVPTLPAGTQIGTTYD